MTISALSVAVVRGITRLNLAYESKSRAANKESPDPHCVDKGFQNLVKAVEGTRPESSITHDFPVYTTSQSRSQRCFRVSSDGGQQWYGPALDAYSCDHHDRKIRPAVRKATFRANSIQVDRSQLCMPEGSNLNETSLGTVLPLTTERVARKRITKPPDLELVEHGKPLERCVRPMKSREYLLGLTTQ